MPIKSFDSNGECNNIRLAEAIYWAVDHGAKIINLSVASPKYSLIVDRAISYAKSSNVIVVASSGNFGTNSIMFPANLVGKVISVGSYNKYKKRAFFSNYGDGLTIYAPGEKIYSTYWSPNKGSLYTKASDASISTGIVSGAIALAASLKPDISGEYLFDIFNKYRNTDGDSYLDLNIFLNEIKPIKIIPQNKSSKNTAQGETTSTDINEILFPFLNMHLIKNEIELNEPANKNLVNNLCNDIFSFGDIFKNNGPNLHRLDFAMQLVSNLHFDEDDNATKIVDMNDVSDLDDEIIKKLSIAVNTGILKLDKNKDVRPYEPLSNKELFESLISILNKV